MNTGREVLIIGGGVIGLCCAWYARAAGHRVTILERGNPGRGGCSLGNAGMIVPSHFVPLAAPGMVRLGVKWMGNPESPFYIRPRLDRELAGWGMRFWRAATRRHVDQASPLLRDLNLESRAEFVRLHAEWPGGFGLETRGLLMLCRTGHGLAEEIAAAERARQLGLSADVLTPAQLAEREPELRLDVCGGVFFAQDAHLDPARFFNTLAAGLLERGVRLVHEAGTIEWRRDRRRILAVRAGGSEFGADDFVLAAGVWSTRLARALDLNLPMQPGKGYSLTLDAPLALLRSCAILTEARVAVTPMGGKLRFAGTMELSGLDETVNARRVAGIAKSVAAYLPDFSAAELGRLPAWCGLRPVSPDGLPYLGRSERWRNLVVATGHAMMGLSLAPITGRLVADLLSDRTPSIPLAMLSPDRYA
ncbi:MAG: FAD-dependent oxidoreductase [Verrucomicrobiales bacterium]|nr:FAD-dependent oxidoreductase [Verrucomicrobiales bacterium]MCP5528233.1 FAD-dependent oxidoreductase [Verrucomicrobiales bacterium]